jgi:hypothetical protein
MKNFVVYISNGQVVRNGSCQDETFSLQANEGEFVIESDFIGNQYVENGVLIDMPEKPVGYYIFDYATKSWEFDRQLAESVALQQRDFLLKDGPDRISPLWWSSMTPEQQAEWSSYRQALLDITSQPDYPSAIIWPIKPGMGE